MGFSGGTCPDLNPSSDESPKLRMFSAPASLQKDFQTSTIFWMGFGNATWELTLFFLASDPSPDNHASATCAHLLRT